MGYSPSYRYVPVYLNDVLWKYIVADVNRIGLTLPLTCLPIKVTNRAKMHERARIANSHFSEIVSFKRVTIPMRPGLSETRLYGVHNCMKVDTSNKIPGALIYDIPDDPEDSYYDKYKK